MANAEAGNWILMLNLPGLHVIDTPQRYCHYWESGHFEVESLTANIAKHISS